MPNRRQPGNRIMPETTYPTVDENGGGLCYPNAFALLGAAVAAAGVNPVRLCHGIVRRTKPPHELMGHAWIELYTGCNAAVVIDHKFPDRPIPREQYYALGNIEPSSVRRYTAREARRL